MQDQPRAPQAPGSETPDVQAQPSAANDGAAPALDRWERSTLEKQISWSFEQGLIPRKLALEEIFVDC